MTRARRRLRASLADVSLLIRPLLVLLTFIVIVVVALMLIFGGFGGGGEDGADDSPAKAEPAEDPAQPAKKAEPKKEDPIAAADLKVGVCISDALSTLGDVMTFERAECNEAHDGEVYTLITLPGAKTAKYPGTEEVTAKGQRGCRARLRRQATADAFRDRELGYKFVYPTSLSWADGDREITCLATFKKPRTEPLEQR